MAVSLSVLGVPDRLIKHTTSRCPACLKEIDAQVVEHRGGVVMRKRCPDHGPFEVRLARDARSYHDSRGAASCCGEGGCCTPPSSAQATSTDPFEVLSTCVALIEIVDSCNLRCPTCFASSPWGTGQHVDCTPFDECVARIQGVIDRKGVIDILQFSGGEPTIHPEFLRLLDWALDNPKIGYILINTNAVRIAGDAKFRAALGERRRAKGKFELYVQFDGVQEAGQVDLRGEDLRALREKAIDSAGAEGVPSTLAMVVTPATLPSMGDALRFALARPHCRGIVYQPMFTSGRVTGVESSTLPVLRNEPPGVVSVGDVITGVAAQCPELLREEDFTPLPCGDPNCHTISYLLRLKGRTVALGALVDLQSLQGFLSDRVDYRLEDLAKCGCESEPLAAVLKSMELGPDAPFRVFIKPFMDAWTFDQDRIDRCCTHVIRKDGSLDSFCRYYMLGGAESRSMLTPLHVPSARGTLLWTGAIALSLCMWWFVSRRTPVDRWTLLRIYAGGLVGAFAGAKMAYLLAEGWAHAHDLNALLTGKSVLGAVPGGYAGVVATKQILGVGRHTGDWFALAVPAAVALGRVSCLIQGCCAGVVCGAHWWAWTDAQGTPHWPAQAFELGFNLAFLAWALLTGWRGWARDNRFHAYMIAYGVFRAAHEFARPTEKIAGMVSGYQVIALALAAWGTWLYHTRKAHAAT